jgi:hypothetical protein
MCLCVSDRTPVLFDRSVGPDQRGGSDGPFNCFALGILPRAPGAVSFHHFDLWIGQQYERQIELSHKLVMRIDSVSADTDNHRIGFGYGFDSVAEPARFLGSAWGIVLGIKPQHYVLAGVVR